MKLYVNDPDIRYKTTEINPLRTKADIDGILARWGIKKVGWEWDPDNNKVLLQFQFSEKFKNREVHPFVKVEPPRIWNKRTSRREESINWRISMRVFYWYIKTTLEMAYAMQSEKTVAFLAHIETGDGQTVKDVLIPRLEDLSKIKALEAKVE